MRALIVIVAMSGVGLVGCIPTPIPRPYEFGALVPGVSGSVVDAESGAPISDAKITVQYADCCDLRFSTEYGLRWKPQATAADNLNANAEYKKMMRSRSHPPAAWLAADHAIFRSKSDTTDSSGKFEFGSHDRFTFIVIPLVPDAPVGDFYDKYLAAYRLVIEHPDYGVQTVQPSDEIKLKKTTTK